MDRVGVAAATGCVDRDEADEAEKPAACERDASALGVGWAAAALTMAPCCCGRKEGDTALDPWTGVRGGSSDRAAEASGVLCDAGVA